MAGSSLIVATVLVLSLGSPSFARETPPSPGPLVVVQSAVARVFQIVESSPTIGNERRTGLLRVSHDVLDFDEIARRALGQRWRGLSPEEQHEFVRLFTEIVDRAFIASVDRASRQEVTFLGESIDGPWARVRSRLIPSGIPAITIDYQLHKVNTRWAVYDVVWERVSLVANYRSEFDAVIRASSFAQLLEQMRTDTLRRRPPSTQPAIAPNWFGAALLLGILTRQAPASR